LLATPHNSYLSVARRILLYAIEIPFLLKHVVDIAQERTYRSWQLETSSLKPEEEQKLSAQETVVSEYAECIRLTSMVTVQ
jgi:hypothetical protein